MFGILKKEEEDKQKRELEIGKEVHDTLAPTELVGQDLDNIKPYINRLKFGIKDPEVNNIALMGTYGSGKSTILKNLQEEDGIKNSINFLNLSLGSYNSVKSDNESEVSSNEDEKLNDKLEKSLVKQMIYREEKSKLPFSRFKKINHISIINLLPIIICFSVTIICFFYLNNFLNFQSIIYYNLDMTTKTEYLVDLIIFMIFLIGIIAIMYGLLKIILRQFKLSKFSVGQVSIEGNDNNSSYFNKYIDEIIYYFETKNYDVVVIEDIDRFNNILVFEHLKELNYLLNNSEQINRNITFIYSVKEDIFSINKNTIEGTESEIRTKFFEMIIPIIPVSDNFNAGEFLLPEMIKRGLVSEQEGEFEFFLKDISLYIYNLRVLKNIISEFVLFKELHKDLKNASIDIKLFSIVTLKNLVPSLYTDLQKSEGFLYDLFVSKDVLKKLIISAEKEVRAIDLKLLGVRNSLELKIEKRNKYDNELRNVSYRERLIYAPYQKKISEKKYQINELQKEYIKEYLIINGFVDIQEIEINGKKLDNNLIESLEECLLITNKIESKGRNNRISVSIYDSNGKKQNLNISTLYNYIRESYEFDFRSNYNNATEDIEQHFYRKHEFKFETLLRRTEREMDILYAEQDDLSNRKKDLIKRNRTLLNNTVKENIEKNSFLLDDLLGDVIFHKDKDLLLFLLGNGYLEEDYSIYMSLYYGKSMKINDKLFLIKLKSSQSVDFSTKLDSVKAITSELSESDWKKPGIVNLDIIKYLFGPINNINLKRFDISDVKNNIFLVFNNQDVLIIKEQTLILFKQQDDSVKEFLLLFMAKEPKRVISILNNEDNELIDDIINFLLLDNLEILEALLKIDSNLTNPIIQNINTREEFFENFIERQVLKLLDLFNSINNELPGKVLFRNIDDNYLKEITEKKLYEFNKINFNKILNGKENFDSSITMDLVLEKNDKSILENIENNFEVFFKNILNTNIFSVESERSIKYLLNKYSEDESVSVFKYFLNKTDVEISELSSIQNDYLWKEILLYRRCSITWDNLIQFYNTSFFDISDIEIYVDIFTDYSFVDKLLNEYRQRYDNKITDFVNLLIEDARLMINRDSVEFIYHNEDINNLTNEDSHAGFRREIKDNLIYDILMDKELVAVFNDIKQVIESSELDNN